MSVRDVLPFGKHAGQPVGDVPSGYLIWLVESSDHLAHTLRRTILEELRGRITGELARLNADLPDKCPRCHNGGGIEYDAATHTALCTICAAAWSPGRSAQ